MKYTVVKERSKDGKTNEVVLMESSKRQVAVGRIHWLFNQQLMPWKNDPRCKGFDPKKYEFWAKNQITRESIKVRLVIN
jgi:hypothetical protein